jgi:proprotein convertase subtilisin/kexin type 2
LPRASAATRAPALACVAVALSAMGCSGGDGDNVLPKVSAGASCELSYVLTNASVLTGADPLLDRYWHLRNTGQSGGSVGEDLRAIDAWQLTRGAGVRVAVIDDAVEVLHPDLQPNLVEGASRSYRPGNVGSIWPVPCKADEDDHGTAVAGLVLARDGNSVGGAGVAPRAALVAFDALASGQDVDIADALVRDNALNAIYQNSWGSPDDGRLHPVEASFHAAIENGITLGRGGRGVVYVFPGGNGGCFARDAAGVCQSDNANFDAYVNRRGVIATCAVDDRGRRPWYGEPGANLLVCAPSSGDTRNVHTTALRGGYRNDFSGTSASTPMVSGVVALMLAANPQLSWRDVRLILAQTARRNDPDDPGWSAGAGIRPFHHSYGFGVADAKAAVQRASTWTSVGNSRSLLTCAIDPRTPGIDIPDAVSGAAPTPIQDTTTVTGCAITQIEFVEVQLTAPHTYSGDLQIRLTAPSGSTSELANGRICLGGGSNPCGEYREWTFGSVRHLDEAANGAWTLQVTDTSPFDTGRLESWRLRIHGR